MQIFHQSVFDKWPIDDKSIQSIITSPPYYLLRKYEIPDIIIGGDENCEHEFNAEKVGDMRFGKGQNSNVGNNTNPDIYATGAGISNICLKCGAFKGQYGNEPHPLLFLHHTMLWLQEAWRVLKDDGILFLNIDDSYAGSNKGKGAKYQGIGKNQEYYDYSGVHSTMPKDTSFGYRRKSKLLIPERLMVMMSDAGWIIRGNLRWIRTMPESVQDRFSAKSETIIFATKNPDYYFNLNAVKEPIKANTIQLKETSFAGLTNDNQRKTADKVISALERTTKIKEEDAELFGSPRARYHRKTNQPIGIKGGGNYAYGGINADDSTYRNKQKNGDENALTANPGDVWLELYLNAHKEAIQELGIDGYINALKSQILHETDIFPPFIEGLKDAHYAPFSTKLVRRLILCSTKDGDTVLDPFCGSGTTLKVADELNRIGKGMDLGYKNIQQRRLKEIQKALIT